MRLALSTFNEWAVDKTTKKMATPQHEVLYEIYADGLAPVTNSKFTGAPKHTSKGTIFYGKGLKVDLTSRDGVSGVEKIHYSFSGSAYADYGSTLDFGSDKEYTLYYFGHDNVGNAEKTRTRKFTVDTKPPEKNMKLLASVTMEISSLHQPN